MIYRCKYNTENFTKYVKTENCRFQFFFIFFFSHSSCRVSPAIIIDCPYNRRPPNFPYELCHASSFQTDPRKNWIKIFNVYIYFPRTFCKYIILLRTLSNLVYSFVATKLNYSNYFITYIIYTMRERKDSGMRLVEINIRNDI